VTRVVDGTITLGLLQGFEVRSNGTLVALPLVAQRLIAFLALQQRPVRRAYVANILWLDASEDRAHAALRTTLWRARTPGAVLVDASSTHLTLAPGVAVDHRDVAARTRRVLRRADPIVAADFDAVLDAGELLPDWYEDWVLLERERFRQLRLHALEAVCDDLMKAGRHSDAAEAALAAVAAEPLRESAHRLLMRVYLAEGNPGEAIRQYDLFRTLLHDQLGLEPSSRMRELIESCQRRDVAVTGIHHR
jgi:DNA-binding SARP family transcriptional activator